MMIFIFIYTGYHRVFLSIPPRVLRFELYSTYMDIEQSGIWAFWRDNPTIISHMVQV